MLFNRTRSINNKVIRLTDERWFHIIENHTEITGLKQEVLETVYGPDFITSGILGELYACKYYQKLGNYLIVIYKEENQDGFIITAFRARNIKPYLAKKMIWTKQ